MRTLNQRSRIARTTPPKLGQPTMYIPKRSSTDMGWRLYAKQRVQRFSPVPVVRMEMPKLTVEIKDSLIKKLADQSEQLWPGQGRRGVSRLSRDAVRRYWRYSNGTDRNRSHS